MFTQPLDSFLNVADFYRINLGVDNKKLSSFHKDSFINLDPPPSGAAPTITHKVMIATGSNWSLFLSVEHRDEFRAAIVVRRCAF